MARLANGLAAVFVVLALAAPANAATAPTTITTVAGGGSIPPSQDPNVQSDALQLLSPNAVGVASGLVTLDTHCTALQAYPPSGSNVGPMEYVAGVVDDCVAGAPPANFPSLGSQPLSSKFTNACCIRGWGGGNWIVANRPANASRVEMFNAGHSRMETLAGGTGAANCGTATAAAPPDNVGPTSAQFCHITALGVGVGTESFLIGEMGRQQNGNGNLYEVQGTAFPYTLTVHHLTNALTIAGVAYTQPGGSPVVADGVKSVWLVSGGTPMRLGGPQNFPAGFSGDGGGVDAAQFNKPSAVAMTYDEGWLIADTDNCRIRRVKKIPTQMGQITTIAGSNCLASPPAASTLGDGGPSTGGYLHKPKDIAMTPGGVLIADTGNNRIRLIDRTSILSAPSGLIADSTPDFTFASFDTPPRLRCSLDDGVDFACPSPFTLPATTDGPHTLKVWEGGHDFEPENMLFFSSPPDPVPSVASFTVDTTGPLAFALKEPAAGATGAPPSPVFSWDETSDANAGVAGYELWIDGTKNRDVSCCNSEPAGPLAEGAHKWQIRAVDGVGNVTASEERSIEVGSDPVAVLVIGPNPVLIGRPATFDGSGSSDPSGIARYEWDLDGDGTFETDTGATSRTTNAYPAAATVPVALRVTDGAGKTATAGGSLRVLIPPAAASLLGVSINEGAQFTRSPDVTVTVKSPVTTTGLIVSNDGGFFAPTTFTPASTLKWKLDSSGPERLPKTVYLRFQLGPIVSDNYTDDIILDEVPPVVQQAALVPTRPGAASAAALKKYVVKVKAKDSNSGVSKVQVTANKRKPGKLLAYKKKLTVKLAAKPKYLRARDKAGNFSAWKKLR